MTGNSTLLRADVPTRGPGKVFPCRCGGSFVSTLDTRASADGRVRRRRECPECGARVTTYEDVDESTYAEGSMPAPLRDALLERLDVVLAGGGP